MTTRLQLLSVLLLLTALLTACRFKEPLDIGYSNGSLSLCPESPNCVSTLDTGEIHAIDPIKYSGTADEAMATLIQVIDSMPRTRIISREVRYLHVTFTTAVMRYVDDVQFLIDEEKSVIHFRSASRLGYGDMGTNRARMELVRSEFADAITEDKVK
jgi:uncharacterized protein (DUF1499 family)